MYWSNLQCTVYLTSITWRFHKIVWPSQNIRTLQTCMLCIVSHLFIQQNVKKCTWHQNGQTMDETHQCISALDNFQKLSFKAFSQMTPFLLWGGIFAPWILLKLELFGFQAASDGAIFWRNYASKYQLFVQFNLTFYKKYKSFSSISTSWWCYCVFFKNFDWKSYFL